MFTLGIHIWVERRCKLIETLINFAALSKSLAQSTDLSKQDYWKLSSWELNGQEIKNTTKIAIRLCYIQKEPLSYQELTSAIRHTAPEARDEMESSLPPRKKSRLVTE